MLRGMAASLEKRMSTVALRMKEQIQAYKRRADKHIGWVGSRVAVTRTGHVVLVELRSEEARNRECGGNGAITAAMGRMLHLT